MRTVHAAQNLTQAAYLAQAKLELAKDQFKQHQLFEGGISPGESTNGVENGMNWQLETEWTEVPHLLKAKITIEWQDLIREQSYQCESLFFLSPD